MNAKARITNPQTSHNAAESVQNMTEKREAILHIFKVRSSLTDFELMEVYQEMQEFLPLQSESGIRTRRSELVRMGLLKDGGERRPNENGRSCVVWTIVK